MSLKPISVYIIVLISLLQLLFFFPLPFLDLALLSISFSFLTLGKFLFLAGSSCSLWQYFTEAQIVIMIKMGTFKKGSHPWRLNCSADIISFISPLLYKEGPNSRYIHTRDRHIWNLKRTGNIQSFVTVDPASRDFSFPIPTPWPSCLIFTNKLTPIFLH